MGKNSSVFKSSREQNTKNACCFLLFSAKIKSIKQLRFRSLMLFTIVSFAQVNKGQSALLAIMAQSQDPSASCRLLQRS